MPPKIEIDTKITRRIYMRRYRRKKKAKINKMVKDKDIEGLMKVLWKT